MSYKVLARKWRPQDFSQVVGQGPIVQALENSLNNNQLHQAYLFTGTRGVGKTTLARILAKCLLCETGITSRPCNKCNICTSITNGSCMDVMEVDAASKTKVEDTRDLLDKVQYAPTQGRFKIYIIDEVHMLSGHSFNAMLKTLEEPPEHVKFLLATTDPQKLPATVLSRCLQYHLKALPNNTIQHHLENILKSEKINFESDSLALISQAANGSVRDSLSILDQAISYCDGNITLEKINNLLGLSNNKILEEIIDIIKNNKKENIKLLSEELQELGADFYKLSDQLLERLHNMAFQTDPEFNQEQIQLIYQIILHNKRDMPYAPTPQLGFEMMLLRIIAFKPVNIKDYKNQIQKPELKTTEIKKTTKINFDWVNLHKKLNLSGMARALVDECEFASFENNNLLLNLAQSKQAMVNKERENLLKQAIESILGEKIKFKIQLINQTQHSPAQVKQEKIQQNQKTAENNIQSDATVDEILTNFNGTILGDSVKPIEN